MLKIMVGKNLENDGLNAMWIALLLIQQVYQQQDGFIVTQMVIIKEQVKLNDRRLRMHLKQSSKVSSLLCNTH